MCALQAMMLCGLCFIVVLATILVRLWQTTCFIVVVYYLSWFWFSNIRASKLHLLYSGRGVRTYSTPSFSFPSQSAQNKSKAKIKIWRVVVLNTNEWCLRCNNVIERLGHNGINNEVYSISERHDILTVAVGGGISVVAVVFGGRVVVHPGSLGAVRLKSGNNPEAQIQKLQTFPHSFCPLFFLGKWNKGNGATNSSHKFLVMHCIAYINIGK